MLIGKREGVCFSYFNGSKAFVEFLNDIDNIYENIEQYNPNKERKILIVFDYLIADMFTNKKLQQIVKDLFIRGRKLNISLTFITQSYFEKSFKKFY